MNSSDSCQNTLKPHFQTIFGIFRALLTRQDLFSKNQVSSLCLLYNYLTLYKKLEKNWQAISEILRREPTGEWTDERTDKQSQTHRTLR